MRTVKILGLAIIMIMIAISLMASVSVWNDHVPINQIYDVGTHLISNFFVAPDDEEVYHLRSLVLSPIYVDSTYIDLYSIYITTPSFYPFFLSYENGNIKMRFEDPGIAISGETNIKIYMNFPEPHENWFTFVLTSFEVSSGVNGLPVPGDWISVSYPRVVLTYLSQTDIVLNGAQNNQQVLSFFLQAHGDTFLLRNIRFSVQGDDSLITAAYIREYESGTMMSNVIFNCIDGEFIIPYCDISPGWGVHMKLMVNIGYVAPGTSPIRVGFESNQIACESSTTGIISFAQGNFPIYSGMISFSPTENADEVATVTHNFKIYPNPFAGSCKISFDQKATNEKMTLRIYNIKGEFVDKLISESNQMIWNGKDRNGKSMPSGVYIFKLENNESCLTKKAILVR